jgi:hypothetical protein
MRQDSFLLVSSPTWSFFVLPTVSHGLTQGTIPYRNIPSRCHVFRHINQLRPCQTRVFPHSLQEPPPKEGLLSASWWRISMANGELRMYIGVSRLEPCGLSASFTDDNSTLSILNELSSLDRLLVKRPALICDRSTLHLSGFALSRSQLVC